ncbi:MAG: hypothetical protein F6K28_43765 [Microcoleus sp. SIO2G3]|nr:hypothetical protein [Microcoleus sp. SIO2G3]
MGERFMLHCDRFRWALLPLLTGAMLVTGSAAQADVVIIDNGSLSIGVGSIDRVPGIYRDGGIPGVYRDRHPFYSNYDYRYPQPIYTNRIEDSTLINPVVIGVPIEDSTLINPVIVPPSRRDRRTIVRPYLSPPRSASSSCNYFASERPACW